MTAFDEILAKIEQYETGNIWVEGMWIGGIWDAKPFRLLIKRLEEIEIPSFGDILAMFDTALVDFVWDEGKWDENYWT